MPNDDSKLQAKDKFNLAKEVAKRLGLKRESEQSFLELCKKKCDPEFLADCLSVMFSDRRFVILRKVKYGETQREKKRPTSLRPLDSTEIALGGIKKRDLEPLRDAILELVLKIEALNDSYVIGIINSREDEYDHDIYRLPKLLTHYANHFIPLVLDASRNIGGKKQPEFRKLLNEIIDHVKAKTGKFHDRLIADVLSHFDGISNEQSLKQWWQRNHPPSMKKGNAK